VFYERSIAIGLLRVRPLKMAALPKHRAKLIAYLSVHLGTK